MFTQKVPAESGGAQLPGYQKETTTVPPKAAEKGPSEMKAYDLMIIGPATRDLNIDYTGAEDRSTGGAVTFCTPAATAAGAPQPGRVRWT